MDIIRKRVPNFAKLPLLAALALLAVIAGIGYATTAATPAAQAQTSAIAPKVSSVSWYTDGSSKTIYRPGDVATIRVSTDIPLASQAVTPELRKHNWITAHHGASTRQFFLARIDSANSNLYYEYTVKATDVGFGGSGTINFGKYETTGTLPVEGRPARTGQGAKGICSQAAGANCAANEQFQWRHAPGVRADRAVHLKSIDHSKFQISATQPVFTKVSSNAVRILVDPDRPYKHLKAGEPVSLMVQLTGAKLHSRHHITPAMANANYVMLTVGKNTTAKAKLSAISENATGSYLVYTYITQASDYTYGDAESIGRVSLNNAAGAASNGICSRDDGSSCAGYDLSIEALLPHSGMTAAELGWEIKAMAYEVSFPKDMPSSIEVASHTPYTVANGPKLPLANVNYGGLTYTINDYATPHTAYPAGLKLVPTNDGLVFIGTTDAPVSANPYQFKITATADDGETKATSYSIELRVVNRQGPTFRTAPPAELTIYQDWRATGESYTFPTATAIDDAKITYSVSRRSDAADTQGQLSAGTHSNLRYNQDTRTLSVVLGEHNTSLRYRTPWIYTYTAYDGLGGMTEHKMTITVKERPAVKSVTVAQPAAGNSFGIGEVITATVSFWDANLSELGQDYPYSAQAVTVAPAPAEQPYLTLQIGDHVRQAQLVGRQDSDPQHELRFAYTVTAADQDSNGISIASDALQKAAGITGAESYNANPVRSVIPVPIVNSSAHRVNGSGTLPTYAGIVDPVITLYHDKGPNPHQSNVLPKPLNATAGMTYTLTDGANTVPTGLRFNAATRAVTIGEGNLPAINPQSGASHRYRLTATDASISLSVGMDVTIRYAYRPQPVAYTIAGPDKPNGQHDSNTYEPGDVIEVRINYGYDIELKAGTVKTSLVLPIKVGTKDRNAVLDRIDSTATIATGAGNHRINQAVFAYTLQTGDGGRITVPEAGPNAPGIIGRAQAIGQGEPIDPRLPVNLNAAGIFFGKNDGYTNAGEDRGPYAGINSVSANPQSITYEGVDDVTINLYQDGKSDTYGTDILPAPLNANANTTHTLTKANGNAIPAGLVFNAATRKVSIGSGTPAPPATGQYQITATDSVTGTTVDKTVTIRYVQRPQPAAYAIVGPRKPKGEHDTNTYQPGDVIEFRINYDTWLQTATTVDQEFKGANTLEFLIGSAKRTAKFDRLDTHVILNSWATDHTGKKQVVFTYTLQTGDSGGITVPTNGIIAPGIIGGPDDSGGTATTGYGEVASAHLPASPNNAHFYGKTAESTARYIGTNNVTAAPNKVTFEGTTPAVKTTVTLYDNQSNPYTPPTPLHAATPVTWEIQPNDGAVAIDSAAGTLSVPAKPPHGVKDQAYTVKATDRHGREASFSIAITTTEAPALTPIAIRNQATHLLPDHFDASGYYTKVGGALVWTVTYNGYHHIRTEDNAPSLNLQIGKHKRTATYWLTHASNNQTAIKFRYLLQATDMDDQVEIADPPLNNPDAISATVAGHRVVATNNRQDAIWNWNPTGPNAGTQVIKVDGNPQAPRFPADGPSQVTLLMGQHYGDETQDYLRNTLNAASSPTIANYGPLTYSIKEGPQQALRHGAKLHVKDGVPTIWTGSSGAGYEETTQRHTLVATDFRGRTAEMDFTINYERAASIAAGPAVPAVLDTGDLLIVYLRHKQALTDAQKTTAASTKMTIRTGNHGQPDNIWQADYSAARSTKDRSVYTYTVKSTDQEASVLHISVRNVLENNPLALYAQGGIPVQINPDGPPRWADKGYGDITCDTMTTDVGGTCLLPTASNGFGKLSYQQTHIMLTSGNRKVSATDTSLSTLPGITTELNGNDYVVKATHVSGAGVPSGLDFAYKVCDEADVCTNERQVSIIWTRRPYVNGIAISNEFLTLSPDGRTQNNPSGLYADGTTKFYQQGNHIIVALTLGVESKVPDSTAADQRPYVEMDIGGTTRRATLIRNKTVGSLYDNKLYFQYEVQAEDYAPEGIAVNANGLKNCVDIVTDDINQTPMVECPLPSQLTVATPVQGQRRADSKAEFDLDADNDGLIEIRTAAQFNLMRHDIDAQGNIDAKDSNGTLHAAAGSFPDYRKSSDRTTGCPSDRCIGYELAADLTLNGNFEPFLHWNAVLEGNGHTISGLRIVNGSGMFARTGSDAVIRNIGFISPTVQTDEADGGAVIAGVHQGAIANVYVGDGAISGNPGAYGMGMIAANMAGGTIRNVYATGTVSPTAGAEGATGTLVGNMTTGTLENSYSRTNRGVGNGNQFRQYATIAGALYGGAVSSVWEEEGSVTGNPDSGYRTKTPAELREATGFPGWGDAWDFGDNCQYPVLTTGGHDPSVQTARGAACPAE